MSKCNLVAAYARVSTEEQAEQGLSIPAQKSRLLAYCQSQGWEIFDFYVDDGYSGKDLERPAIKRLIEDARNKVINIALVLKLDRISRRQKDVLYLLEDVFETNGVGFKSVTETFDTTTSFGKAAIGMMAVFAQLERETILERTRMGKLEAARKGRWHGGTIYGYSYEPGTYILKIRESEAKVVRGIYDMYLDRSYGITSIANDLNDRGVPGPDGGHWIKQTVSYILNNPTYAGYSKHKGSLYEGIHEAIITKGQWEKTQELLKQRRGKHNHRHPSKKALLAGIIYCTECGARMRNKTVWQNYPYKPKKIMHYYVCYSQDGSARHMVRDKNCRCGYKQMEDIDNKVIKRLFKLSFNEKLLEGIIKEELAKETVDQKNAIRGLNQSQKELQQVNKSLDRWYEVFEKGALDPNELTERVKNLRAKREHLENSIREWEEEVKEEKQRTANVKEILETMINFRLIWDLATPDEKRDILINLIQEVRVNKASEVEVKFNL
ncbi:DNA-invertase hin [Sporotomaculum syntrophicum]|uniref:DNA-invertase hin n=1 Tax=Sporotomaculum syntrophicum TaxID=182264 RepID=A0A9D2WRS4_9FIRM|nr:recombinase family protein [Sporotomaculum syntrophicum]KAF1085417.1 DNA-invertase hin [Sporotomaculum syntrophicum]